MGEWIQTVDHELSQDVARRVRARYRRCWLNAARAVHWLGEAALYVEGWVVVSKRDPLVIEHGWCEIDGRIVDPSYTRYVSNLEPPLAYFSGHRYEAADATAGLERRQLPLAWLSARHEYRHAFEAAWRDASARIEHDPKPPTRVVHCRREPSDIFIGRPSKWGGPFHLGRDGSREEVIEKYRQWLIRQPLLLREVRDLRGHALGCDCKPDPCHGDVLAELADMGAPLLASSVSAE